MNKRFEFQKFTESGNVHSYKEVWKEDLQQWDIFLQEEECDTYVCSFSKDEQKEKNEFMKSSNGF